MREKETLFSTAQHSSAQFSSAHITYQTYENEVYAYTHTHAHTRYCVYTHIWNTIRNMYEMCIRDVCVCACIENGVCWLVQYIYILYDMDWIHSLYTSYTHLAVVYSCCMLVCTCLLAGWLAWLVLWCFYCIVCLYLICMTVSLKSYDGHSAIELNMFTHIQQ